MHLIFMEDFYMWCSWSSGGSILEEFPVVQPAEFVKSNVKATSVVFRHINYTKTVLRYLKSLREYL